MDGCLRLWLSRNNETGAGHRLWTHFYSKSEDENQIGYFWKVESILFTFSISILFAFL